MVLDVYHSEDDDDLGDFQFQWINWFSIKKSLEIAWNLRVDIHPIPIISSDFEWLSVAYAIWNQSNLPCFSYLFVFCEAWLANSIVLNNQYGHFI